MAVMEPGVLSRQVRVRELIVSGHKKSGLWERISGLIVSGDKKSGLWAMRFVSSRFHHLPNCFILFAFPLRPLSLFQSFPVLVIKYSALSTSVLSTELITSVFVLFGHSIHPLKLLFSLYSLFYCILLDALNH